LAAGAFLLKQGRLHQNAALARESVRAAASLEITLYLAGLEEQPLRQVVVNDPQQIAAIARGINPAQRFWRPISGVLNARRVKLRPTYSGTKTQVVVSADGMLYENGSWYISVSPSLWHAVEQSLAEAGTTIPDNAEWRRRVAVLLE
jgi:hypothetical protein